MTEINVVNYLNDIDDNKIINVDLSKIQKFDRNTQYLIQEISNEYPVSVNKNSKIKYLYFAIIIVIVLILLYLLCNN